MSSTIDWSRTGSSASIAFVDDIELRVDAALEQGGEVEWHVSGFAPSRAIGQECAGRAALAALDCIPTDPKKKSK